MSQTDIFKETIFHEKVWKTHVLDLDTFRHMKLLALWQKSGNSEQISLQCLVKTTSR